MDASPCKKKGSMDDIPVEKEFTTISMVVPEWSETEQFSSVHRIKGFPFRLGIKPHCNRGGFTGMDSLSLVCDLSREAELWKCTATVKCGHGKQSKQVFCSWRKGSWVKHISSKRLKTGSSVQIEIAMEEDESSFFRNIRPYSIKPPNGILVIGEEKKEILINKEFLASQSPYFHLLFFGDFKEKNMDRISIGGVGYEEFHNIIKMVYGSTEAVLMGANVHSVLDLADRFDLKIVQDRVVSFLLSGMAALFFSQAQILHISQERNLPTLKKLFLIENGNRMLLYRSEIEEAPEYS